MRLPQGREIVRMCEEIATSETVWCNHKLNYIGSDRFCRWCRLDYRHPQRGKWMRLLAWCWYWAPIYFRVYHRGWYNQHDLVIISSWGSASIVLLSLGFHIMGSLLAVVAFAFAMLGLFLAETE